MSSSVSRLWSLNRILVMGSNEVESPNTSVAITYIYYCMSFLIAPQHFYINTQGSDALPFLNITLTIYK
jgi:hypothetical protein